MESIYQLALEKKAEDRIVFIRHACGGDEEMRRELEEWLAAKSNVGSFLCRPAIEQLVIDKENVAPPPDFGKTRPVLEDALDDSSTAEVMPSWNRKLMAGQVLFHYEVAEKLGEGGMGVVYKARDLRLNRLVALKFLSCIDKANPELLERFHSEARAISALNHPHIAGIYDFEEVDDTCFIVMEYFPGGTLRKQLKQLRENSQWLSFRQIVDYARQIASGLSHAHQHGIIHRDVKADNLMLTEEGIVKLADFGLARLQGESGITRPGIAAGTLAYMAPELLQGKSADVRSDLYSLGVVLYELITTRRPFEGESAASIIHSILHVPPAPISSYRPNVPQALVKVILRLLEKDPELRYQKAGQLLEDLKPLELELPTLPAESLSTATKSAISVQSFQRARLGPSLKGRFRQYRRLMLTVALIVLTIAAIFYPVGDWVTTKIKHLWSESPRRVAVLPFQNIGGIASNQAFCDGLVETLTTRLSELEPFYRKLWIVPSSESRRIQSGSEARRCLGVDWVISGSVQCEANLLRLTLHLDHPETQRILRSVTLDRTFGDLINLQESAAREVMRMLELELKPEAWGTLEAAGTRDSNAYECYLQGAGILSSKKPELLAKAISMFEQAVQKDPQYAVAYAGLSTAWQRSYNLPSSHDPATLEKALSYGQKALKLNPRLVAAHIAVAQIYRSTGKYELALAEIQQVFRQGTQNSESYRVLADVYDSLKQASQAEDTYKKAIEMQPEGWVGYNSLGYFYFRKGRYNDAMIQYQKVLDMAPGNFVANNNLGAMYLFLGEFDKSVRYFEELQGKIPNLDVLSNLGTAYYFVGRFKEAVSCFKKAVELGPRDYGLWGNLADAFRWAGGNPQEARTAYARALELVEKDLKVNSRDVVAHASRALYLAKSGRVEEALQELAAARKLDPADSVLQRYSVIILEIAGQREQALQLLGQAIRSGYTVREIQAEPELASLRKDPRFSQAVNSIPTGTEPFIK